MNYKIRWPSVDGSTLYNIYKCDMPGDKYQLFATSSHQNSDIQDYTYTLYPEVDSLSITAGRNRAIINWEEPLLNGSPSLFKVLPDPSTTPSNDTVWFYDGFPNAESIIGSGVWTPNGRSKDDLGNKLNKLELTTTNGSSTSGFEDVSIPISAKYIAIWIQIKETPDTVMFEFQSDDWEHRVYWGSDRYSKGKDGTPSRMYMGELPSKNSWTPLIIPLKAIELENKPIHGMTINLYRKPEHPDDSSTAKVYIDAVAFTDDLIISADYPHDAVASKNSYSVYRKLSTESEYELIAVSDNCDFTDAEAYDINSSSSKESIPFTTAQNANKDKVIISWEWPSSTGTTYDYKITCNTKNGLESNGRTISTTIENSLSRVDISYGLDWGSLNTTETITESNKFEHACDSDTYYFYRIDSYNANGDHVDTKYNIFKTGSQSILGYFVLGEGILQ